MENIQKIADQSDIASLFDVCSRCLLNCCNERSDQDYIMDGQYHLPLLVRPLNFEIISKILIDSLPENQLEEKCQNEEKNITIPSIRKKEVQFVCLDCLITPWDCSCEDETRLHLKGIIYPLSRQRISDLNNKLSKIVELQAKFGENSNLLLAENIKGTREKSSRSKMCMYCLMGCCTKRKSLPCLKNNIWHIPMNIKPLRLEDVEKLIGLIKKEKTTSPIINEDIRTNGHVANADVLCINCHLRPRKENQKRSEGGWACTKKDNRYLHRPNNVREITIDELQQIVNFYEAFYDLEIQYFKDIEDVFGN